MIILIIYTKHSSILIHYMGHFVKPCTVCILIVQSFLHNAFLWWASGISKTTGARGRVLHRPVHQGFSVLAQAYLQGGGQKQLQCRWEDACSAGWLAGRSWPSRAGCKSASRCVSVPPSTSSAPSDDPAFCTLHTFPSDKQVKETMRESATQITILHHITCDSIWHNGLITVNQLMSTMNQTIIQIIQIFTMNHCYTPKWSNLFGSNRPLQLRCVKEQYSRSFLPGSIRLYWICTEC